MTSLQNPAGAGSATQNVVPGLEARRVAADLLNAVLHRGRTLDEQLDHNRGLGILDLQERDRALARRITATALRRLGTLRRLLAELMTRGIPPEAMKLESILLVGAVQVLFFEVPDHAAVDLAVRLASADRRLERYTGLVNAVLRRIARGGKQMLERLDLLCLDTPDWMLARWTQTYGADTARDIAYANRWEPALDLSVKGDPEEWAQQLGGRRMPTDSVRLVPHGPVTALPGYQEGSWWVQDAAAALPARLMGDVRGLQVADLCAAPGGKTAQLATLGAVVTAVDRSPARMALLGENLNRLGLTATAVVAPAEEWQTDARFDAVLVDAPCTSTGTIRRHPDIAWRKSVEDLQGLIRLQKRLLSCAVELCKPGATIVYCTCSLEPEEGEHIVASILEQEAGVRRKPVTATEFPELSDFLTPLGELRTLPCHWPDDDPRMAGLDGFFAARLERV